MKQFKKVIFSVLLTLSLVSCYNSEFEDVLFRNTQDPFYDIPVADSLAKEHTVYLSWKVDDAADKFLLMRALDAENLNWICVYEGIGTNYTDENLPDKELYVYRLDKKRGAKYFTGAGYAYGFSLDGRRDRYENNDVDYRATMYRSPMSCTLPCVRYKTNNKLIVDEDWFSIKLAPMQTAHMMIVQNNMGTQQLMKYQERGKESETVITNTAKRISNTTFEDQVLYFKIYPETTALFTKSSGIASIQYTISCTNITAYSVEGGE